MAADFGQRFSAAFRQGAHQLGLDGANAHLPRFLLMAEEIVKGNPYAGLTRIVAPAEMARKHFLDSLTCLLSSGWSSPREAVDVGSGAGFPGMVLAIAVPECHFVLVEARERKARFLARLADCLHLDAEIIPDRAETFGRTIEGRGRFGVGLSRAAAKLPVALEYVLPLVGPEGCFIAQLGPDDGGLLARHLDEPSKGCRVAWKKLGAELTELKAIALPEGGGHRWLACFRKTGHTPDRFPRRPGVPARRPLALLGG